MLDTTSIVRALMEGGLNNAGGARLQNAVGSKGLGGSGMGDLLGNILGGSQGGAAGQGGGQPGAGLGNVLGGLLGGGRSAGLGSAAIGGVLGSVFGGGGVGGVAKGGAMAVLGMLAVNALKGYVADKANDPGERANMQLMAGLREPETAGEQQQVQELGMLVVKAMINAAKADGHIDAQEMEKIAGRVQKSGVDDSELAYIRRALAAPMDTDGIVAAVNDPQVAAQIYSASLLAITVDTEAERAYIQELGDRLALPQAARNEIHAMLGV